MPTVHAVLVAYENPARTLIRWYRDVEPALSHLAVNKYDCAATCVDNSSHPHPGLVRAFGDGYLWQDGRNLMYGPSINLALKRVPADYLLYACTNHGRAFDPTWAADLLAPLVADPTVALAGTLTGSSSPAGVVDHGGPGTEWVKDRYYFTHDNGLGHVPEHVQGGVFAGRVGVMMAHPYPEAHPRLTHLYTDHLMTWELLKNGYRAVDVPAVRSVWKDVVRDLRGVKYVHDTSEEP